MADDDFDIDRLAAYLHLDPAQVARLAERGRVPGRKVAGQWRFSPGEIHHWLEERIGLSSDEELKQMETALRRPPGESLQAAVSLAAMLPVEAIAIPLAAKTRGSVITRMCELAAATGWLWDPAKMSDAVRQREDLYPTALDNGAALLHPRRPLPTILDRPFLAFGRTATGIPFGGTQGTLTDLFFLILSTDLRSHLRVLARLSRLLTAADFLAQLRSAADAREAHELIARQERELPA